MVPLEFLLCFFHFGEISEKEKSPDFVRVISTLKHPFGRYFFVEKYK
jgi:hypothetical protein